MWALKHSTLHDCLGFLIAGQSRFQSLLKAVENASSPNPTLTEHPPNIA
jgi:hypothetical protein